MAIETVGASLRGPAHERDSLPNQDAWATSWIAGSLVLVVSDGLGSRPLGHVGSDAACRAALEATEEWLGLENRDIAQLPAMIEAAWTRAITPHAPTDCAATCRCLVWTSAHECFALAIGDGLTMVAADDTTVLEDAGPQAREFSNTTDALGASPRSRWRTATVPLDRARRITALLATDGISDDLRPGAEADFARWLVGEMEKASPDARTAVLEGQIKRWPTPGHSDDKTILLAWEDRRREVDPSC
jgi:serine/threonine protein phosphatase PrpC